MIPKLATSAPFQAGSLLIWQDPDNFIRLDRCGIYSTKERNAVFFYLQAFKDGKRAIDKDTNKVINVFTEGALNQDGELRLERKQGKVYPAFSQDGGKTWLFLPLKSITTDLPRKVKVGVGAVNNTTKVFTIGFQDFQVGKSPSELGSVIPKLPSLVVLSLSRRGLGGANRPASPGLKDRLVHDQRRP